MLLLTFIIPYWVFQTTGDAGMAQVVFAIIMGLFSVPLIAVKKNKSMPFGSEAIKKREPQETKEIIFENIALTLKKISINPPLFLVIFFNAIASIFLIFFMFYLGKDDVYIVLTLFWIMLILGVLFGGYFLIIVILLGDRQVWTPSRFRREIRAAVNIFLLGALILLITSVLSWIVDATFEAIPRGT